MYEVPTSYTSAPLPKPYKLITNPTPPACEKTTKMPEADKVKL